MSLIKIQSTSQMEQLGKQIAPWLHAGDVVVLHGPLGAGKTTFVRGLGEGLGVEGMIQSPTFVVARIHQRTDPAKPQLVHVDAYRFSHSDELLDLDIDFDHSITVMEWGRPYVERVAEEWLDIDIHTPSEDDEVQTAHSDADSRIVGISGHTRSGQHGTRYDSLLKELHDSGN